DRLVEELPVLVQAATQATEEWSIPEGGVSVNNVNVDARFGGQFGTRAERAAERDWNERLIQAIKPALLIFLVGAILFGLTAFLAWDLHTPVARDSAQGSRIVDELGMFGKQNAIVELNKDQTDAYVAAQMTHHRGDMLLCLGIGILGLAVGSVGIAWHEAKELRWSPDRSARV
ncbi:MAG: hypothetical protein M1358_20935, partial [Chloroflexi bacterium]|nr:hypothetical protein [Chloroflexota bacterium]